MFTAGYNDFVAVCGEITPTAYYRKDMHNDVFDLAHAFLYLESMTPAKLQKLCYYAKAWYLALYDTNLIQENFEAWAHGAIQPALFQKYRVYGFNYIPRYQDLKSIPEEFLYFARDVYESYGHLDGCQLEQLNHTEMPWVKARGDLKPWQSCSTVIDESDMKNYYRVLKAKDEKK